MAITYVGSWIREYSGGRVRSHPEDQGYAETTLHSVSFGITSHPVDLIKCFVQDPPKATNAGTYTVTIGLKDKDNYRWSDGTTDDFTVNWTINKAVNTITMSTGAVTKMTGADKYQIRVAQNAKMTKGKKTYTAKGTAASKTTGKLTKGKTYYVQIRAYDKQTKSWGAWSAKKKVKISK